MEAPHPPRAAWTDRSSHWQYETSTGVALWSLFLIVITSPIWGLVVLWNGAKRLIRALRRVNTEEKLTHEGHYW
jgi:hypothetical protein